MDNHCVMCGAYLADTSRMVCPKCEKPKTAELKPCPFCGGKEIDVCKEGRLFGKSAYARTYIFLRCRKCYARTGVYGTKPKAIAVWNRRSGNG